MPKSLFVFLAQPFGFLVHQTVDIRLWNNDEMYKLDHNTNTAVSQSAGISG